MVSKWQALRTSLKSGATAKEKLPLPTRKADIASFCLTTCRRRPYMSNFQPSGRVTLGIGSLFGAAVVGIIWWRKTRRAKKISRVIDMVWCKIMLIMTVQYSSTMVLDFLVSQSCAPVCKPVLHIMTWHTCIYSNLCDLRYFNSKMSGP